MPNDEQLVVRMDTETLVRSSDWTLPPGCRHKLQHSVIDERSCAATAGPWAPNSWVQYQDLRRHRLEMRPAGIRDVSPMGSANNGHGARCRRCRPSSDTGGNVRSR